MPNQLLILTALGSKDKPGIIAKLTRTLLEAGGNLDDATMTRLHGAFATMIAARVDSGDVEMLRRRLDDVAADLGLHITLDVLEDQSAETASEQEAHRAGPDHIITVYGADHPGIVHHVAALMEEQGVNITDLETHLTGSAEQPIYVMMLETSGGDWDKLPHALSELGKAQAVDVSFSALDEETL